MMDEHGRLGPDHLSERRRLRRPQLMTLRPRPRRHDHVSSTTTPWPRCRTDRAGGCSRMALVPFWDIDAAVAEVARAAEPRAARASPCAASRTPAACPTSSIATGTRCGRSAASSTCRSTSTSAPASSAMDGVRASRVAVARRRPQAHVVGCVMIELHNARDPGQPAHRRSARPLPQTEVGVGRERHRLDPLRARARSTTSSPSTRPRSTDFDLSMTPSELLPAPGVRLLLVRGAGPARLLDHVGVDNVLFETDFPHPTCLYPSAVEHGAQGARTVGARSAAQGHAGQRGQALPHRGVTAAGTGEPGVPGVRMNLAGIRVVEIADETAEYACPLPLEPAVPL